ncbi:LptF/LptG family permease [Asticcacaulis sp. BYS171W]|uniref:LptF/LptG family permease n=1 Tax=Asticcacaulis aquaticus TaxID=2984212 RepID=A0ABT5HNW7_9CAUL|nr:LptF/LptG family permease [Asticcacaulis aquaticus]MDC7681668.1 LptF/LptG family permease [Asticcacaulis aquaticus]
MRTIESYISKQMRVPIIGAILALTAIAILSQSLTQFDIIVERGQSAATFFKVTFLALPQLAGLIFPLAIFIGTLVALNRLHNDHEIVACYANGMSLWRIASPVVRFGVCITLLGLVMSLFVQPAASRIMRTELFKIKTDVIAAAVREGDFSTTLSGMTIYVQRIDQNGLLRQIFIRTPGPNGLDRTYSAREGRVVNPESGGQVLILRNGSTQQVSPQGVLNHLTFNEYSFDISQYVVSDSYLHFKDSDRFPHELFFPNRAMGWENHNWKKLVAEGHARISGPLYNLGFSLLAVVGVLGGAFSRHGYTRRIAMVSFIAAGIRILGFAVEAACAGAPEANFLQYVVPLGLIYVCMRTIGRNDRSATRGKARHFEALTSGAGRAAA